jgi:low temperature requirement protein LtrA
VVPLVSVVWTPDDPAVRAERDRTRVVTASVVERFDLLTIIVLGEVIVGVVDGVSGTHALGGVQVAAAGLGLLLAFALWWLYFDVVAHRRPVPGPLASAWFYLHLPVAAGIAATGAAVLDLVGHAGEALPSEERGLLVASVAVTQAGVGALLWTLPLARDHGGRARVATVLLALSILGALSVGLTTLSSVWTLLVTDALLLVPVGYSLWVWVTVYGGEEPTIEASSGLVEDG